MPTVPRSTRPPWLPERVAHGRRNQANTHIYNSKAQRKLHLQHKRCNPICVECEANGRISPVEVTDHINPINQGGIATDWNNLQSLCKSCHAAKSGREAHTGRGGSNT